MLNQFYSYKGIFKDELFYLFYIVSTSITQSGQTLELIAILAGGFLLVNFSMAQGVNLLNRRMALKGYGA